MPSSRGTSQPRDWTQVSQVGSLPSEPPRKPKNTRVSSLSLLQGNFLAQELNQCLLHCRQILYQLSYQGSPETTIDETKLGRNIHRRVGCWEVSSVQFSSVAQSCPTLCDHMNHSTPGLPVHHQLPEFTQTHVLWVGDAIQPSHPLLSPSPPALNLSQHQGLFKWVSSLHHVAKVLEFQLQHQSFQRTPRSDLL